MLERWKLPDERGERRGLPHFDRGSRWNVGLRQDLNLLFSVLLSFLSNIDVADFPTFSL